MAEEAILEAPEVEDDAGDDTLTADIDIPTMDDTEDETDDTEKEDTEAEKVDDTRDDELQAEFKKLQKSYDHASAHIDDLKKAVHGLRQENKELRKGAKKEDDEAVFTDAQLIQIIDENKDDPGVMLHAMKQLIKQSNADVQALTDKKVETSKKQTQIEGFMDSWKGHVEKNRDNLDKIIDFHDLGDHFAKDHLALGAMIVSQWPEIVKKIKDEATQEALSGKSEKSRKSQIKNGKPETGSEKTGTGDGETPTKWVESANSLFGGNKKLKERYLKMMKEKSSKKKGD